CLLQLTHCVLNHFRVTPDVINHTLASCCAGLCYFFYPEMTLFSYAVVHAFQTLWKIFEIYGRGTENKISKTLLSFPYTFILYPLIQAHCGHVYIMRPQCCSPLCAVANNTFTNNHAAAAMKTVQEVMKRVKGLG
uniref:Uncharacterized protein n=1 Tax=Glossina brevipalpis TaxID=37001 RepID=A0A1A9W1P5_9MUSC